MAGKPEGVAPSPNIYQRILAITQELGAIEKTGQADPRMGGYEFIEHAQIMGRLRTLLVKHGVTIIPSMRVAGREAVPREGGKVAHRVTGDLTLTVINADRPDDRFTIEWPGEALDNQDKATQKAGTSAEKYALMKLFKISDREDPDGALVGDEEGTPSERVPMGNPRGEPRAALRGASADGIPGAAAEALAATRAAQRARAAERRAREQAGPEPSGIPIETGSDGVPPSAETAAPSRTALTEAQQMGALAVLDRLAVDLPKGKGETWWPAKVHQRVKHHRDGGDADPYGAVGRELVAAHERVCGEGCAHVAAAREAMAKVLASTAA